MTALPLFNNINVYLFMGLFLLACGIVGVIYRTDACEYAHLY